MDERPYPDPDIPEPAATLDPTDLESLLWWVARRASCEELPVPSTEIQPWLDKLEISWRQFWRAAPRAALGGSEYPTPWPWRLGLGA